MRWKNIFLAFMAFSPNIAFAQRSITLNKSNTLHYGDIYLIKTPVTERVKNLFIYDPIGLIPAKAYHNPWYDQLETLFIAMPTKGNTRTTNRSKIHSYSYDEFIIHVDSYNVTDSLRGIDDSLLTFRPQKKPRPLNPKKEVIIYYRELTGTPCCYPERIRYSVALSDFIKGFEEKYQVKIGRRFGVVYGEEGEGITYLTLDGLTLRQKLKFLNERSYSLLSDIDKKEDKGWLSVYRPVRIPLAHFKRGLNNPPEPKLDLRKTYTSVDRTPTYPDGLTGFSALFKDIDFGNEEKHTIIISFVVKRDGSLEGTKVVRGATGTIEEQVKNIITKSKRWSPGILDGEKVNTIYSIPVRYDQLNHD